MNETDDILIDGSLGEGGGQIVRSSLALSMVTGKPFAIKNIRAGRERPGLMQQHLTSVQAAARVCNAYVEGAEIGSGAIRFQPGTVIPGVYKFSVRTAGSGTLVLQTILPALMIASGPSQVTIEGGTHNQWAPPFDFLQRAYLPLVNQMGPRISVELSRYGFYPAGKGEFTVDIQPSSVLKGFDLLERGQTLRRTAVALVARLPQHIGEREVDTILRRMQWAIHEVLVHKIEAAGPGNVVFASLESEYVTEVFTGFGRLGTKAEHVAKEVIEQLREYLKLDVPVGPHLADQLLLPLGLSASMTGPGPRGGTFKTGPLTDHSTTHIKILKKFLNIEVDLIEDSPVWTVNVKPG